jgi:hypothetical protein
VPSGYCALDWLYSTGVPDNIVLGI